MKNKISIIGSGVVGSNIAYALMLKNIVDEIALIDVDDQLVMSEILDIKHGIHDFSKINIVAGQYEDVKDSRLIIVTAGRSRNPNETRLDMVIENVKIAKKIAKNIKEYYKDSIIIVVSNPVDIVTYQMCKILDLRKNMIFGTGCMLDTSRFIFLVADYIGCKIEDVNGIVIGEHGDSQVIAWSKTTIKGMPIEEYCKLNNIEWNNSCKSNIENDVVMMGANIISRKGKTHFGISTCVCYLVDAIVNNKDVKVSVSSCLDGEYGINDVALSLPFVLNGEGLKELVKENYNKEEVIKLNNSAIKLKEIISNI